MKRVKVDLDETEACPEKKNKGDESNTITPIEADIALHLYTSYMRLMKV